MLRPLPRHEQREMVGDATHGGDFELGAAVREVADHAIEPGAAAVVDDGRHDHGVAPRRDALFEPKIQRCVPAGYLAPLCLPSLENAAMQSRQLSRIRHADVNAYSRPARSRPPT